METINNKLPEHLDLFLQSMRKYINKQVYYYGSVQRFDYLDSHSDIDLYIFTDGEISDGNNIIKPIKELINKKVRIFIFTVENNNINYLAEN